MIYGNAVGGTAPIKTLKIVDEDNNEYVGVITGSEVVFDATPADVRINKTFAGDEGIQVGENTITYRTTEQGFMAIMPEEDFVLPFSEYNQYNYTELQCMFAPFNTSFEDSTAVDKIVLQNSVFAVNSTEKISSVTKDDVTKSINFNITNNSENPYLIYYFTYCQEEI